MEQENIVTYTKVEGASTDSLEELPMVVILRGDEPYAESFCRDADYVMKKLQIKRSRLTQISGKDLRVGRIRVDRYVRPMYRDEDVEKYQSWTRSPATHKNSSQMIDLAVERLEQKSEEFALGLKDVLTDIESGVAKEIKDHIKAMVSFQRDDNHRFKLESDAKWENVFKVLSKQVSLISELRNEIRLTLEETMNEFSSYSEILNYLHLEVKELRVANRGLQNINLEIKESLDSIKTEISQQESSLSNLIERVSDDLKYELKHVPSEAIIEKTPQHKYFTRRHRMRRVRKLR